jgi:hypothetical protein
VWDRPEGVRRQRLVLVLVVVVLVCAWCGWVSGFHRDTVSAEVTWLVSLGAVVAVDVVLWAGRKGLSWGWRLEPAAEPWPRPGRGGPTAALLGAAPWLGLVLIALAWDILALDTPPNRYHLTISALSQAYRALNAVLLLVWLGVGVGYGVARARAPSDPTRAAAPPDAITGASAAGFFGTAATGADHHPGLAGLVLSGLLLPEVPALGVAFWVVVPLVAIVIDFLARRSGGRIANAEEILRFISTAMPVKVLLAVAWGFAGYHLFAR